VTLRPSILRPRRALTLLEVLIAIVVLAALLAVALPVSLRLLDEGEVSGAEEEVAAELLKARVRAQEGRRPVEVLFEGQPPRLVVRWFDPALLGDDRSGSAGPDGGVTAARARTLSGSFRVLPMTDVEAETGLPSMRPASDAAAAADPFRVAVFLPDGTPLFTAPFLLLHTSGLRSGVSIDPWTGQPAVRRRGAADGTADGGRPGPSGRDDAEPLPRVRDEIDRPEFDFDFEVEPPSAGGRGRAGARGLR